MTTRACNLVATFVSVVALCATAEPSLTLGGKDVALFSRGAGEKTVRPVVADAPEGAVMDGVMTRFGDGHEVAALKPLSSDALRFDIKEVGYYTIVARLVGAGGAILAEATNTYAVTPPIPERPNELGVCFHSSHCERRDAWDISFDLLDTAGFARIRDDLSWGSVERKKGEYGIPARIDKTVALCQEHGIKPLYIFGYPSPAYKDYKKGFPTNDITRTACAEAMAFAVGHFRGKVFDWELWNEPNQAHPVNDYLPLAKVVYPRVKAVAPEINLITGGGSGAGGGVGGGYIYPVLNAGGREFQDGWSAHPYMAPRNTPDLGYRGGPPLARASLPCCLEANLKWGRASNPGQKPLQFWITEYGWFTNSKGVSEELQAAYLARALLICRRHGLDTGLFFYDFMDDGLDPEEKEHHFGIVRHDFSPKPSFQAIAVFASLFANKRTVSSCSPAKDAYVLTCGEKCATVTAIWSVAPTKVEIDWFAPRENLVMLDWQGRRLDVPSGEKLCLDACEMPVYFIEK